MEYDIRCLNCLHKSHEDKPCAHCPAPTKENPTSRCTEFTRPDLFAARCLARIEQSSAQAHGQLMMGLATIFDLLAEAYPDAANKLQIKLAENQKKHEEELVEHQKKMQEEADAAFQQANEANEQRAMEELVEEYTQSDNVVSFPVRSSSPEETA